MPAGGLLATDKAAWRQMTPYLVYCVLIMCLGEMLFGMDGAAFASLQTLPDWLQDFGQLNAKGKYALTTQRKSIMTSIQWVGKLAGVMIVEPIANRFGYRVTLGIMCLIQFVGCALELATKNWIVFSVGRVLQYLCIGIVENIGPTYAAEISPAPLRAACVSMLFVLQGVGNMIITAVVRGIAASSIRHIWMVVMGVQLIPGLVILFGTPFIIESPRWLIEKDRKEEAFRCLARIRPKPSNAEEINALELEMMHEGILHSRRMANESTWKDLFRGTNFRRTMIAIWIFIFQQWTGQQFVTSYGPTFYASFGIGANAYTYTLINGILHTVLGIPIAWWYDRYGRRPFLIHGTWISTILMLVIAIIGGRKDLSDSGVKAVVGCLILFKLFESFSLSQACWIIGSEIGSSTLRKKTMAAATFVDVLAAFGVTYSSPYMLDLWGAKVAWLFTILGVIALVFSIFFVPETANRSLEELDEMFEKKLWAWRFEKYETQGLNRDAELEDIQQASAIGQGLEDSYDKEKVGVPTGTGY
ncbi:hypothetical protein IAT40_001776 [Kwoniella sp. CBS 6097]